VFEEYLLFTHKNNLKQPLIKKSCLVWSLVLSWKANKFSVSYPVCPFYPCFLYFNQYPFSP